MLAGYRDASGGRRSPRSSEWKGDESGADEGKEGELGLAGSSFTVNGDGVGAMGSIDSMTSCLEEIAPGFGLDS